MKCFIVAEAGVNHNGDESLAVALVDAAVDAGADAVKFQTFRASRLVRPDAAAAAYQKKSAGVADQLSMLKALELSDDSHRRVIDHCRARQIEFMSTPFDIDAARFLVSLGMRRLKVPSGELDNRLFLEELAAFGLPMILSTGMASLHEVSEAVGWIRAARPLGFRALADWPDLLVLHCTSNYPTALADVNLLAMRTMAEELGVPVGYSDHTAGTLIPALAVALGARVVEKHFTLDRSLPGPDHHASLEPGELRKMVEAIRAAETALGSGVKVPRESEDAVRRLVRRSIATTRDLPAGTVIDAEHVTLLRPADGIPARDWHAVIGRIVAHDVPAMTPLRWEDLR